MGYGPQRFAVVQLLSHVQLFVTPWTIAYQASLFMGFSRQEYWSGLPFPSSGDLPDSGIEPGCPALQADDLPTELCGRSMLEGSEAQKEGGACCIASAWDIYHF